MRFACTTSSIPTMQPRRFARLGSKGSRNHNARDQRSIIMTKRPDLRYERRLWKEGLEAVAGVGEAGVGPMAGPGGAAGVVFFPETLFKGVHDFQQLPPPERAGLFVPLLERAVAGGVG